MSMVSAMPSEAADLLDRSRAVGFGAMMYAVDRLDGEIDAPIEILGHGLPCQYMEGYLNRLREDPLRRMVARGEINAAIPIVFENDGKSLSVAKNRRMSAGDLSLLRWCLSNGVRTGVSFRVRMERGRGASLNFYSANPHTQKELDVAVRELFLLGHELHARLAPRMAHAPETVLSERETECLEWIALGKSNREIAQLLGLSFETVKEHVQSLFQKLKVNGRAQAVSRGHMLAYLS